MIIGIAGHAGVGKDTVGHMLLNLTNPYIWSWEIKKFAAKLKEMAAILLGVDPIRFEDIEYKNSYLPSHWDYWTVKGESFISENRFSSEKDAQMLVDYFGEGEVIYNQMTVRELLQDLGTEAVRDVVHPNTWVNALLNDYEESQDWIITDVRFPNEVERIRELGGKIIFVDDGKTRIINHESERPLEPAYIDAAIKNYGTLQALQGQVEELISKWDL